MDPWPQTHVSHCFMDIKREDLSLALPYRLNLSTISHNHFEQNPKRMLCIRQISGDNVWDDFYPPNGYYQNIVLLGKKKIFEYCL